MVFDRDDLEASWVTVEPEPWSDANDWTVEQVFAGKRERKLLHTIYIGFEDSWSHNISVVSLYPYDADLSRRRPLTPALLLPQTGRKPAPKNSAPNNIALLRGSGQARIEAQCGRFEEEELLGKLLEEAGGVAFDKDLLNDRLRQLKLGTRDDTNENKIYPVGSPLDQDVWEGRIGDMIDGVWPDEEDGEEPVDHEEEGLVVEDEELNLEEVWGDEFDDEDEDDDDEAALPVKKRRVRVEEGDEEEEEAPSPGKKKVRGE